MTLTTERPLTEDQRIDQWRFARDVERARRDNTCMAPTASDDYAPSTGGAAFSPEDRNPVDCEEAWWQACIGLIGLIVFLIGTAVAMALVVDEPAPDPDCRMQFNNAARYVEHCDFHDGRGYVEVRDE